MLSGFRSVVLNGTQRYAYSAEFCMVYLKLLLVKSRYKGITSPLLCHSSGSISFPLFPLLAYLIFVRLKISGLRKVFQVINPEVIHELFTSAVEQGSAQTIRLAFDHDQAFF